MAKKEMINGEVETDLGDGFFAERIDSGRRLIRMVEKSGTPVRIGEVTGRSGRFVAHTMSGEFKGVRPSLLAAAKLLQPAPAEGTVQPNCRMSAAEHDAEVRRRERRIAEAKKSAKKLPTLGEKVKAQAAIKEDEEALRQFKLNYFELVAA